MKECNYGALDDIGRFNSEVEPGRIFCVEPTIAMIYMKQKKNNKECHYGALEDIGRFNYEVELETSFCVKPMIAIICMTQKK